VRQLPHLLRDRLLLSVEIRGWGDHVGRDIDLEAEFQGESAVVIVPAHGGEAGWTIEPHFSVSDPGAWGHLIQGWRDTSHICGRQCVLPVGLNHESLLGDVQLDAAVLRFFRHGRV